MLLFLTCLQIAVATPENIRPCSLHCSSSQHIIIHNNCRPEDVATIPTHKLRAMIADISAEAVQALPPHILDVVLLYGVPEQTVANIPKHIHLVSMYYPFSASILTAIPPHVGHVNIYENIPIEAIHHIRQNIYLGIDDPVLRAAARLTHPHVVTTTTNMILVENEAYRTGQDFLLPALQLNASSERQQKSGTHIFPHLPITTDQLEPLYPEPEE